MLIQPQYFGKKNVEFAALADPGSLPSFEVES
jgi:hypothetical protein